MENKKIDLDTPVPLPTGLTEFNVWFQDLIEGQNLPTMDERSLKFVVTASIMGLDDVTIEKPRRYFINKIKAAAAKQVAGHVFTEIKEQQRREQQEAANKAKEIAESGLEQPKV